MLRRVRRNAARLCHVPAVTRTLRRRLRRPGLRLNRVRRLRGLPSRLRIRMTPYSILPRTRSRSLLRYSGSTVRRIATTGAVHSKGRYSKIILIVEATPQSCNAFLPRGSMSQLAIAGEPQSKCDKAQSSTKCDSKGTPIGIAFFAHERCSQGLPPSVAERPGKTQKQAGRQARLAITAMGLGVSLTTGQRKSRIGFYTYAAFLVDGSECSFLVTPCVAAARSA